MKTQVLLLLLASSLLAFAQSPREVHKSAIVIDTHADTPMRFLDEGYDIAGPRGSGHIDIKALREGGVTAEFFSIFIYPKAVAPNQYAHRTLEIIDSIYEQVRRYPKDLMMARTADDIVSAKKSGKIAVLMGIEGGHSIENDIRLLRAYHELGVRYMTLTWANTNEWADSSGDAKKFGGLNKFGEQVVREMNRLGMMVDISHVSDETFYDVLNITTAPVIASHSSARALNSHARNLTDDMLRAIAKNNGVVQVNFYSMFLDEATHKQMLAAEAQERVALQEADARLKNAGTAERRAERRRIQAQYTGKVPRPPLKSLVDHIDHIAKVAGVDHVGLGSDFDGIEQAPQGIDSAADLPKITEELMKRGYPAADVRKILGANLLRVMREVEKAATAPRLAGAIH